MSLTVDLKYSNLQRGGLLNEGETAPIRNANVDATLAVSDEAGWAGSGPVGAQTATPMRAGYMPCNPTCPTCNPTCPACNL